MEVLDQLSVALGFATLAGINLYLTTFVTGLAIRFHWVVLTEQFQDLEVLGSPLVLGVAGALVVVEFLADKIPWVDSAWDSVHTLIRPVGGGLLAMSAIGATRPEYDVITALLGAGAASVSHGFKATTRLAVNHSPEPVSNSLVSVAEDAAVVGGLSLMAIDPKILAAVCLVFLGAAVYSLPRIFRRLRGSIWLLHRWLVPGSPAGNPGLALSAEEWQALREREPGPRLLVCLPVLTLLVKPLTGIGPWRNGHLLVAAGGDSEQGRLLLVVRHGRGGRCAELPTLPLRVAWQPGWFADKVCLYDPGSKFQLKFGVPRGSDRLVRRLMDLLSPGAQAALPHPRAELTATPAS